MPTFYVNPTYWQIQRIYIYRNNIHAYNNKHPFIYWKNTSRYPDKQMTLEPYNIKTKLKHRHKEKINAGFLLKFCQREPNTCFPYLFLSFLQNSVPVTFSERDQYICSTYSLLEGAFTPFFRFTYIYRRWHPSKFFSHNI